jgi:hypothetical protein
LLKKQSDPFDHDIFMVCKWALFLPTILKLQVKQFGKANQPILFGSQ